MSKLKSVENDAVTLAKGEVSRIEGELVKWRKNLAEVQGKVEVVKKQEKELADERASLVLLAKVESHQDAQIKLDRLTERSFKATQECGDLTLAAEQVNQKILTLEAGHETAIRAVRMEELKSLGRRRLTLAHEIESQIEQAVSAIEKHIATGREMVAIASIDNYDKFGADRRVGGALNVVDYLAHKFRFLGELKTPPQHAKRPLVQMESESLNGILNEKTGRAA